MDEDEICKDGTNIINDILTAVSSGDVDTLKIAIQNVLELIQSFQSQVQTPE